MKKLVKIIFNRIKSKYKTQITKKNLKLVPNLQYMEWDENEFFLYLDNLKSLTYDQLYLKHKEK